MTRIERIEDVLPHVEGRKDFVVKVADGYTVVDYVYADRDTFDHPVRRECRGIKFGADEGRIIARPFHKFFNVGERDETQPGRIDWSSSHVVTEKLDGSMIHPAVVDGQVRLMTRMGITDVSERCEAEWLDRISGPVEDHLENGLTPIFEWVSPQNRIVVRYPEDRLYLLAIRETLSGKYMSLPFVRSTALVFGVNAPSVLASDAYGDWTGLSRYCEEMEDREGFVVWFEDGNAVKVKAPWYVTRHRALDGLRFENHVVKLVLDGGIDDVLPLLSTDERTRLENFEYDLNQAMTIRAHAIKVWMKDALETVGTGDRRAFAALVKNEIEPSFQSIAFRAYDGGSILGGIRHMVLSSCGTRERCSRILDAIDGPEWK